MTTCRHSREDKGSHTRESRAKSPAFLFAPQFHKSRDNHPHAGRKNRGDQHGLPQIPLRFFESFLFQLAFVCSAMTMRVTDQACARHPLVGVRGDSTLRYTASFRSATELIWGMKWALQTSRQKGAWCSPFRPGAHCRKVRCTAIASAKCAPSSPILPPNP